MKYPVSVLFMLVLLFSSFSGVVAQDGDDLSPITPANAAQITQLAEMGRGQVVKAIWSPDNRFLAIAGVRGVWLYDAGNLASDPVLLDVSGEWVYEFAFSPDGGTLATAGGDGRLRLWAIDATAPNITLQATITAHGKRVLEVVFSADGQRLATTDGDDVHVWPVANIDSVDPQIYPMPEEYRTPTFGLESIKDIAFTPNDTAVAIVIRKTGAILFWNPDATEEYVFYQVADPSTEGFLRVGFPALLAFDPAGEKVAIGTYDGQIIIGDMIHQTFANVTSTDGNLRALVFSPDGTQLVYAWDAFLVGTGIEVRVWDIISGQETAALPEHTMLIQVMALSPDGARLVTIEDLSVRLWDMRIHAEIPFAGDHNGPYWAIAFNPDGTQLVVGSRDQTARLYELETGTLARVLRGHIGPVLDVAYSPDGRAISTASQDRTIRVWDAQTGLESAVLQGHEDDVLKVAFDAAGSELASGAWDNTVRLWDLRSRQEKQTLWEIVQSEEAIMPQIISSVTYSPDGRWLAAGARDLFDAASEHQVGIWDAATKELVVLLSYPGGISGLAFSPDSSMLAISFYRTEGSTDPVSAILSSLEEREPIEVTNAIHLWDVETQTERDFIQLITLDTVIGSPVFSPDGNLLAATESQRIRIWDVETGNELALLEVDTRPFTDLAFNVQGTLLASSGEDGAIRLWGVP